MTHDEWVAEAGRRLQVDEGREPRRYLDSKGIPTIGIGWNLNRGNTPNALLACGVTDVAGVLAGTVALTDAQIDKLFAIAWAPIEDQARASLASGVYDTLTDARRFTICDLVYNMGPGQDGWGGFAGTRALIASAQTAKNAGQMVVAHSMFVEAGQHLRGSAWYGQVGNRAKRNVAMLVSGEWVRADGDGSDAPV